MDRYMIIQKVSYKNRGVLIDDTWISVDQHVNLDSIEIGKLHHLTFAQHLDGEWNVIKVEREN